ncbi:TWiK family of potassium channels protein 7-like [Saccoglossus kowalevskii]|uniref:TWiK family of potassium channels protein 7-like n=1 Tax=Saccoglossus kowalevskii TaxID=10224 RepID=A0ABM0MD09_SACKO|nr:PREDICTED: TWiK family of potassium channels protein 7-like [Saccoglossus kowalevskii]
MASREGDRRPLRNGCFPCLPSTGIKAFLLAHFFCVVLLVGYLLVGAQMFRAIELDEEIAQREHVWEYRSYLIHELWNQSQNKNVTKDEWIEMAESGIDHLSKHLEVLFVHGYRTSQNHHSHWNFVGSLVFSMSVVTTIGYGHRAPATTLGRFVCIVYAIIGIPLTFHIIGDSSKLLFHLIGKAFVSLCCKRKQNSGGQRSEQGTHASMNDNCLSDARRATGPMSASSSRRLSPHAQPLSPQATVWVAAVDTQVLSHNRNIRKSVNRRIRKRTDTPRPPRLPMMLIFIVLICFILLGALYYWWWQGWTYFTCVYFNVISISAIGFGDYMPRETTDSFLSTMRLFLFFNINFMGMAIVTAYITHAQKRIGRSTRKISKSFLNLGNVRRESESDSVSRQEENGHVLSNVRQRNYWLYSSDDEQT